MGGMDKEKERLIEEIAERIKVVQGNCLRVIQQNSKETIERMINSLLEEIGEVSERLGSPSGEVVLSGANATDVNTLLLYSFALYGLNSVIYEFLLTEKTKDGRIIQ